VQIVREAIHVKSVPYAFLVSPGVGYLRLSSFSETTGEEVRDAIQKLEKAGATSLVLDLRDNPGGLLNQAVDVVENFVPRGSLVVFDQGPRVRLEHEDPGRDRARARRAAAGRAGQRRQRLRGRDRGRARSRTSIAGWSSGRRRSARARCRR
jgi:hypothetical protein